HDLSTSRIVDRKTVQSSSRGRRAGRGGLWSELPAATGHQDKIRSDQLLLHEPEHSPDDVNWAPADASSAGALLRRCVGASTSDYFPISSAALHLRRPDRLTCQDNRLAPAAVNRGSGRYGC